MPEIIIHLSKVKENYERLKKALPNAIIAYALKANYDKRILKTLKEQGSAVEICSEYEYEIAKKIGFEKIIINGFITKQLKCCLQNVESAEQKVLGLRGARMKLFKDSKIGLNEKEILKSKWDCISFHSSRAKTSEWKKYLKKALRLADKTSAGIIDAGGGINEEKIKLLKKTDKKLIIEPGRALVENACELKTRILMIKGKNVIIDTGINFFNKLSMSKYEVEVIGKENEKKNHVYRVCGPIPTDIDNIGKHNLPRVKAGDCLRIKNCGAYTMSMASNWTRKKPRINAKEWRNALRTLPP